MKTVNNNNDKTYQQNDTNLNDKLFEYYLEKIGLKVKKALKSNLNDKTMEIPNFTVENIALDLQPLIIPGYSDNFEPSITSYSLSDINTARRPSILATSSPTFTDLLNGNQFTSTPAPIEQRIQQQKLKKIDENEKQKPLVHDDVSKTTLKNSTNRKKSSTRITDNHMVIKKTKNIQKKSNQKVKSNETSKIPLLKGKLPLMSIENDDKSEQILFGLEKLPDLNYPEEIVNLVKEIETMSLVKVIKNETNPKMNGIYLVKKPGLSEYARVTCIVDINNIKSFPNISNWRILPSYMTSNDVNTFNGFKN